MKYTRTEIEYIKNNYAALGATRCGRSLNRPTEVIRRIAKEMGIKYVKVKYDHERNVNPNHFRQVTRPEVAYFLGYFWADGHIHCYRNEKKNLTYHRIAIEIQEQDGEHLKRVAETFGKWAIVRRSRKRYGVPMKPTLTLVINNEPVYKFLYAHGYNDKSLASPTQILAHIPPHLRGAFWLGFFDGDGWVSFLGKYGIGLGFSGSYDQDWTDLTQTLDSLKINNSINHYKSDKGNGSTVNAYSGHNILKFYQYIEPFARLGLQRKQEKWNAVMERVKKKDATSLESLR